MLRAMLRILARALGRLVRTLAPRALESTVPAADTGSARVACTRGSRAAPTILTGARGVPTYAATGSAELVAGRAPRFAGRMVDHADRTAMRINSHARSRTANIMIPAYLAANLHLALMVLSIPRLSGVLSMYGIPRLPGMIGTLSRLSRLGVIRTLGLLGSHGSPRIPGIACGWFRIAPRIARG